MKIKKTMLLTSILINGLPDFFLKKFVKFKIDRNQLWKID